MQRFKNILFVTGGRNKSCPALERAVKLAETNDARLTVIDVIEHIDENAEFSRRVGISLNQLVHDHRMSELSSMLEPYQTDEQLIYTRVLTGSPFAVIINQVMQNGYDLVLKASSPPSNLEEQLLGSTDMHLLRKCPCPVWIERPGKPIPYRSILAAVDPFSDNAAANDILQLSKTLAEREQAQLQVVHAWNFFGESLFRYGRARLPVGEIDAMVDEECQRRADRFDAILQKHGLSIDDENVHLVKGLPVPSILQVGQTADLIVMGTIGRAGVPGFLIGNTAEEVMQLTRASILAVKPEGYVSPLAQAAKAA